MGMVKNKVALITGSGSGIGRATAILFSKEGASVVVSDVNVEGGKETVAMIEKAGGQAIFVEADVSKQGDVKTLVAKTVDAFGRLDCACNVAGIDGQLGTVTEQDIENFDTTVAVNQRGVFLCMQSEIEQMLKNGGGAIVNVASVAGLVGIAGLSPYIGTKHAVIGLTKNASLEYSKLGIRTNAVCPGPINTPLVKGLPPEYIEAILSTQPNERIGESEEVAELMLWLCSDRASYVTGAAVPVDGGYSAQ